MCVRLIPAAGTDNDCLRCARGSWFVFLVHCLALLPGNFHHQGSLKFVELNPPMLCSANPSWAMAEEASVVDLADDALLVSQFVTIWRLTIAHLKG